MADMSHARDDAAKSPDVKYRADYVAPSFEVKSLELDFTLEPEATRVKSRMLLEANVAGAHLVLDGEGLKLVSVSLNGLPLTAAAYRLDSDTLTIPEVPEKFTLEIETEISPARNTALEGLYMSRGLYSTQCEAQGFRRITYFLDRPDVMTTYTVRITADKASCPVLLSNGNPVETRALEDGRHTALWHDPFPKPCYLFALVAGDLGHIEDHFKTRSGREVALRIYAARHDLDKCGHAMESLKAAMRWDEEIYGLEYDLDIYNIVAVSDFNMGAMENKSLNIFNTKCVLARPETATDADFAAVAGVIAHEYFHNWTGNRVTCRDWFQLSLKEGLTVFRDQEFSADTGSRAVKRIDDVRMLRTHQFPEDAGPLSHPVRPDSFIEINNFYTATVYEKGAEVIRMMHRLLGADGFRKGMDLYFSRHDGCAVTCDDFVAAMEDATGVDLGRFRLWYAQAGTPVVTVRREYSGKDKTLHLTLAQETPVTPGQDMKKPLHVPVVVGLLGPDGRDLDFVLDDGAGIRPDDSGSVLLNLKDAEQTFVFRNVAAPPVPSILRGFSAPVRISMDLDRDELRFLMGHDSDDFNRWEASQRLGTRILLDLIADRRAGRELRLDPADIAAYGRLLGDQAADKALIAEALVLPSESDLAAEMDVIDVDAIHETREFVRGELSRALRARWRDIYDRNRSRGTYRYRADDVAARRLANVALGYLMAVPDDETVALCLEQFGTARNMTDESAALRALVHSERPERHDTLERFHEKWRHEDLVIDKWFTLQATAPGPATLDAIEGLLGHSAFTLGNPNRVRALVGAFAQGNQVRFHDRSGRGYRFLRHEVERLDSLNPQLAARILTPLGRWQRHDEQRQAMMKAELEILLRARTLSRDVYEVVTKSLGRG